MQFPVLEALGRAREPQHDPRLVEPRRYELRRRWPEERQRRRLVGEDGDLHAADPPSLALRGRQQGQLVGSDRPAGLRWDHEGKPPGPETSECGEQLGEPGSLLFAAEAERSRNGLPGLSAQRHEQHPVADSLPFRGDRDPLIRLDFRQRAASVPGTAASRIGASSKSVAPPLPNGSATSIGL